MTFRRGLLYEIATCSNNITFIMCITLYSNQPNVDDRNTCRKTLSSLKRIRKDGYIFICIRTF